MIDLMKHLQIPKYRINYAEEIVTSFFNLQQTKAFYQARHGHQARFDEAIAAVTVRE